MIERLSKFSSGSENIFQKNEMLNDRESRKGGILCVISLLKEAPCIIKKILKSWLGVRDLALAGPYKEFD